MPVTDRVITLIALRNKQNVLLSIIVKAELVSFVLRFFYKLIICGGVENDLKLLQVGTQEYRNLSTCYKYF